MKIYVVGDTNLRFNIDWINDSSRVDNIEDADLVLFTGGSDINPELYNEKTHPSVVYCNTKRDLYESFVFLKAVIYEIPILGICRGAQFCCIASGGKLGQHIPNHTAGHYIVDMYSKKYYHFAADHHQIQYPFTLEDDEYDVIAIDSKQTPQQVILNDKNITYLSEVPEIVYYRKTNALGLQFHPEWEKMNKDKKDYLNNLINKYLLT